MKSEFYAKGEDDMTKYKLKLKKEFKTSSVKFKGIIYEDNYGCDNRCWLTRKSYDGVKFSYVVESGVKAELSQKEIDELPHGFVKMHDVIEVKEQLYYIKVPYVTGYECYINEHRDKHVIIVSDKEGYDRHKTKFTKQEIEDRYPLYVNDGCMIKVEDVE